MKPYPNAVLSRFGGEEFTCLIPSQSVDVVKAISHRMLKAVRNLMISHGQSEFGVVTVSIGCCSQQPTADMEVMCLLDGADKALYRAKKQGRNQLYQYNGVLQHDERVENCVG